MSPSDSRARSRWLVPEVLQLSAIDCGPAALKALLQGHGLSVSYAGLRDLCHTDVDGTSIDTLEQLALDLGLEAEQILIPPEHLLEPAARALPAIAVVKVAVGVPHFVVVWSRVGGLVQVMNPSAGRRWLRPTELAKQLYVIKLRASAGAWRGWAEQDEFLVPLEHRLAALGVSRAERRALVRAALDEPGFRPLAALDAATRTTAMLVRGGGLRSPRDARQVLEGLRTRAADPDADPLEVIPKSHWFAQPLSDAPDEVLLRGTVLVRAPTHRRTDGTAGTPATAGLVEPTTGQLSSVRRDALVEVQRRPGAELWRRIVALGWRMPAALAVGLLLVALGVMVEAFVLRGLFDVGRKLLPVEHRIGSMLAVVVLAATVLALELATLQGTWRIGRRLETRLRVDLLRKIPWLEERYFESRPTSDTVERCHSIHELRRVPATLARAVRIGGELLFTSLGLVWLDPLCAWLVLLSVVLAVGIPLAAHPLLAERDLRFRSQRGALARHYLDALLGSIAIRTHGGERALRQEHDTMLGEWKLSGVALLVVALVVEAVQQLVGFGLAAALVLLHLHRVEATGGVLLLVYWGLGLPLLGRELAALAREYPQQRSVALRLLEPLEQPERGRPEPGVAAIPASGPVRIRSESLALSLAGHPILHDIDVEISAGEHVAIVGRSGSGKSSLVGMLLGWHEPSRGRIEVDGQALTPERLVELRRRTAWVDPDVRLWNRSLLANLHYGSAARADGVGDVLERAELRELLDRLPAGLQSVLGESGGLLSGGEGQRVRLARALLRSDVGLAILDEPFRGLDRHTRTSLLARVREHWGGVTVLCITHDVAETLSFPRVLVIDEGTVVADGVPAELAQCDGVYRTLLDEERRVEAMWKAPEWRAVRVAERRIEEGAEP